MRFANDIDHFNFTSRFIGSNLSETRRHFELNVDDMFRGFDKMNTKFSEQLKNFENRIPKDLVKEELNNSAIQLETDFMK